MECVGCGKSFCDKYSLKKHWSRFPECNQETEIQVEYTCEKCDKKFKSKFGIDNHINNTCKAMKQTEFQKKIEELESIIKAQNEKIMRMKERLKGRDSKRFSYSELTSLRDINELKDADYIRSKLEEAIPRGEIPPIIPKTFLREVIAPILAPYIVVTDGTRNTVMYRDGDVIVRKGALDPIIIPIMDFVYTRLNDIRKDIKFETEATKDDFFDMNTKIHLLSVTIKTDIEMTCKIIIKHMYKKTKKLDPKDLEL